MGFIDAVRSNSRRMLAAQQVGVHSFRRRGPQDVRKVADDFLSADHVRCVVGAKRLGLDRKPTAAWPRRSSSASSGPATGN